jgi:hypothetical protein
MLGCDTALTSATVISACCSKAAAAVQTYAAHAQGQVCMMSSCFVYLVLPGSANFHRLATHDFAVLLGCHALDLTR